MIGRTVGLLKAKEYSLTFYTYEGVSEASVKRKSCIRGDAYVGRIYNGAKLYEGDVLEVSAEAADNYTLDPYQSEIVVTGNTRIDITATADVLTHTMVVTSIEPQMDDGTYWAQDAFTPPSGATIISVTTDDLSGVVSWEWISGMVVVTVKTFKLGKSYTVTITYTV